jgi:membrane protease YdiL (CAAX protease family)
VSATQMQEWLSNYGLYDLILLLPALAVLWLYRRAVLRQLVPRPPVAQAPLLLQFAYGVALALAAIALSVLPAWIGGGFSPGAGFAVYAYGPGASSANGLAMWQMFAVQSLWNGPAMWQMFAVQSLCEELVFRGVGMLLLGVLLYWLSAQLLKPAAWRREPLSLGARRWNHLNWLSCGVLSSLIVSVAFGSVHAHNPNVSAVALVNIALAGLLLGELYWMQGTPLGAWALHLSWNAGLATLGLPVSGILVTPPLSALGFTGARAGLLSGGAFGPEGALPNTLALLLLAVFLIWRMRQGLPPRQSPHGDGGAAADAPPR